MGLGSEGLLPGLLGHDAADVDEIISDHAEADPALHSGIASGGKSSATGSLNRTAPAAIVTVVAPPKLSSRSELATIAGPVSRSAICTLPIANGRWP